MNLFDHYQKDPRGADNYPQWCRDRIWELLQKPATLQEYPGGCSFFGPPLSFDTLHEALAFMRVCVNAPNQRRVRVTLLDGAIVKEWGAT
jgi:hypothetical protein